jgi:hypothetical protein
MREMHNMKKVGRNDPCPCGSGKKFKKCCESQMLGGRFKAAKIEAQSASLIQKTAGLSSFFQSRLAETPKKPVLSSSGEEARSKTLLSNDHLEKKEDV